MAVVYESVQTSNSGTTSVTITKPVSLAVGDLMVAHCAGSNAGGSPLATVYSLSGWTHIAGDASQSAFAANRADALYKIADSGDVAASDFTFTGDSDIQSSCGAIYRFTGASFASGAADDDPSATSAHTFTNTITPSFADSIMLFLASSAVNGFVTFDGYAITNNNPTWTERYDINNTAAAGDGDTSMAGATASRPETTATGDSSCGTNASVTDSVGIIVAVYPTINATVSPTVMTVTASIQAPTVTGTATVTPTVMTMTATIQSPTITTTAQDWTPKTKNTSTWTELPKS